MESPETVRVWKQDMDVLMFVIRDRLDYLQELRSEGDLDEEDENQEIALNRLLDNFRKAGLKWKMIREGVWETTLPEGNQLFRIRAVEDGSDREAQGDGIRA